MTSRFIPAGSRLVLPSGTRAVFLSWRTRLIDTEVVGRSERAMERVAVLEVGGERLQFSERFISQARIVPEAS